MKRRVCRDPLRWSISMFVAGAVCASVPVRALLLQVLSQQVRYILLAIIRHKLRSLTRASNLQTSSQTQKTTEVLPQVSGVCLATTCRSSTITSNRDPLQTPVSQELDAASIVISPSHQLIAGAARDGNLWIWGYGDQRRPNGPLVISGAADTFAFIPGCNQLAAAGNNTRVHLWSTEDGSLIHGWETEHRQITSIAVHPSLKRMVTAGREGRLNVWDTESGRSSTNPASMKHRSSILRSVRMESFWLRRTKMAKSGCGMLKTVLDSTRIVTTTELFEDWSSALTVLDWRRRREPEYCAAGCLEWSAGNPIRRRRNPRVLALRRMADYDQPKSRCFDHQKCAIR